MAEHRHTTTATALGASQEWAGAYYAGYTHIDVTAYVI
jgi:hypothetical protein